MEGEGAKERVVQDLKADRIMREVECGATPVEENEEPGSVELSMLHHVFTASPTLSQIP